MLKVHRTAARYSVIAAELAANLDISAAAFDGPALRCGLVLDMATARDGTATTYAADNLAAART